MHASSLELPGLNVILDRLVYHHGGCAMPPETPHVFVYFLSIHNGSDRTVTLLGRKWVLHHADGTSIVVEGDRIVGDTPRLRPGDRFSYNSYHVTGRNARAAGSFHGIDDDGRPVHVRIPEFELVIP